MQQEYSSLIDNGTWELVDLPPSRVVVNNIWICKIKSDTASDVSSFKARFVAKGCSQRAGLDYTETFSSVIRMASLRLFLAIAAARDLEPCQLHIDTAFLYAPIKEDVYIRQPLGFSDGTFKVCHLKRCLYGLKQPPREFNMLLRAWLVDHGWLQCVSDPCIYIFRTGHVFAMIALYVDDIPAACNVATWLASFKAQLGARFKIKDMGDLSKLLGMHVTRDRSARTISLDQSKYPRDILAKYGMTDAKPSSLPMDPGFLAGLAHMTSPPLTSVAKDVYPSLLGSLHYAAVCPRPDVSTALSILGSAQAFPTDSHLHALKKVLRYLHGTIDMRLTLGGGARTTVSNSQALSKLIGQTTVAPASLVRAISSLSDAAPSGTSPNNMLVWPNPLVKPSITLRLTPPRRDSTFANLWGRSSTPSPPKPPPFETTKAPSRTPKMPWSARRPNTSG
jgi:hypothetical protein